MIANIFMSAIGIAIFLLPVCLVLIAATYAAKLFLAMFKPVTEPVHDLVETLSEKVPNPLDRLPMFPTIKRYFGSTKNILFICFVILFLLFYSLQHTREMGDAVAILENISRLFPGSALELVLTLFIKNEGVLDFSSFVVDPDNYLRTIAFTFVSGAFLHIGCTTKAPDAKVHILVKLLYVPLISLFSSIVLGMIPPDMLTVSLPDISFDINPEDIVNEGSVAMAPLGPLVEKACTLLKNMAAIIPPAVAIYFLACSISGFAASFMGGILALVGIGVSAEMVYQNGTVDPNSPVVIFGIFFSLAVGEVIALTFSTWVDKIAEGAVDDAVEKLNAKFGRLFTYYNPVTLLIAYFLYPILPSSIMGLIVIPFVGIDIQYKILLILLALAGLLIYFLAAVGGYKFTRFLCRDREDISRGAYTAAMLFPFPVWIIYILFYVI